MPHGVQRVRRSSDDFNGLFERQKDLAVREGPQLWLCVCPQENWQPCSDDLLVLREVHED